MDPTSVVGNLRQIFQDYTELWNPYETGFHHLHDVNNGRKMSKRQMAIDIMRRRTRLGESSTPLFPNAWIPILASKKLQIGQSVAVTVLGQDLAVFRGSDGKAYVVDAYCPHLGANLGVGGKVEDINCIECPFHGWKFSGENGLCTSIPYSDDVPPNAKIKSWTTCEKTGFIFIWHHAEGDQPSWEIPDIDEIVSGEWNEKGTSESTAFCLMQEIPENGADLTHFHKMHSELCFAGNDLRTKANSIWKPLRHKYTPKWYTGEPPNGHMAIMELLTQVTVFGVNIELLNLKFQIKQIGPALVYLRFSKYFLKGAYVQYITPEGPYQHRVTHALYCNWKVPSVFGKFMLEIEAAQVERDIMIWNNKKFLKSPIIVKEDNLLAKYRRWYSQFYSPNSPTLRDLEDKRLDW